MLIYNLNLWNILIGIVVVGAFGAFSIWKKIVDISGLISGIVVGFGIWLFFGWPFFVVVLLFHLSAAFFTKYKYDRKAKSGLAQEKGGARGWPNVFANGGVPLIAAILAGIIDLIWGIGVQLLVILLFFMFQGGIATMTADTIATETGLLAKSKPRLITKLRTSVEPGTSGGVTWLGEGGALTGSTIIGFTAWILYIIGFIPFQFRLFGLEIFIVTIGGGMIGCLIDSIIGATVQGIFQCQGTCGKITEKSKHCGVPAKHLRGIRLLDNNMVNFTAALGGGITSILIGILLVI